MLSAPDSRDSQTPTQPHVVWYLYYLCPLQLEYVGCMVVSCGDAGGSGRGPGVEQEGWVGLQRKSWRGEAELEPAGMWSGEKMRLEFTQVCTGESVPLVLVCFCVLHWGVYW